MRRQYLHNLGALMRRRTELSAVLKARAVWPQTVVTSATRAPVQARFVYSTAMPSSNFREKACLCLQPAQQSSVVTLTLTHLSRQAFAEV